VKKTEFETETDTEIQKDVLILRQKLGLIMKPRIIGDWDKNWGWG